MILRSKVPKKEALLQIGDVAPDFELDGTEGNKYKLSSFRGRRVLLSFFRFAAWPLCQYNVDRMKQQADTLARADIVMICIFRSTPENITLFASSKMATGNIALSDKKGTVYSAFQLKKTTAAEFFAGSIDFAKNMKKYKPYMSLSGWKDSPQPRQLPADFMIDEKGVIVDLFRAKKPQDHMPFERVEAFIPEDKRCKCNKKECLSPRCREEYAEIKRQSAAMLFMG